MRWRAGCLAAVGAALGCSLTVDTSNLVGGAADAGTDTALVFDDGVDSSDGHDGAPMDSSHEVETDSSPSDSAKDVVGVDLGGEVVADAPDASVGCPADMVRVAGPTDAYCVDATEVTARAYKTWLDATPSTSGQPAECAWNTSFDPVVTVGYPTGWWPPDATHLSDPVRWIDWCDAYAYCAQNGKHLCRGFDGKRVDYSTGIADPNKSQWMRACSANGARKYCFGNTDDGATCAEKPAWSYPVPVGSLAKCVGGYDGLYDMSGNLEEWEDNCQTPLVAPGAGDDCKTRGGSYGSTDISCAGEGFQKRQTNVMWVGFRCCKG